MALVSTATPMTSSMLTAVGVSSGSSACSRDSSMICCTRRESRSLSVSIRPANRLTASGSSLASATASASSLIAPTGVLSSWLTLATKSRRTASTRRSRVRSSTRASTSREPSGRHPGGDVAGRRGRAAHEQLGLADLPVAAYLVDQPVELLGDQLGAADQAEGVRRRGGLHDRVGVVDDHRAAAQHREDGRHLGRHDRLVGERDGGLLAVADVPGEHGAAGDDGPEDGGEKRLCRRVHTVDGRAVVATRSLPERARHRTFIRSSRRHPGWSCSRPTVRAMREVFHDQLESIFDDLAAICSQVEEAVASATEALLKGDAEIAERVISADVEIDRARERVEDKAFSLLSLQAPVAGDLRVVVAALRMVTELERMGDLSVHVAKIARLRVPNIAVPEEIRPTVSRMAEVAEDMVQRVNDVITSRDVDRRHRGPPSDDEEMDQLRRRSFTELLSDNWTHGVEAAVDVALLGRYYERIADHAVSVANRVVFVVTGEYPQRPSRLSLRTLSLLLCPPLG